MKRIFSLLAAAVLCAGLLAVPAHADVAAPATPAVGAYVVSGTATSIAGGEVTAILPGETFNVVVIVADSVTDNGKLHTDIDSANGQPIENYITARITSPAFVHTGPAEVGPYYANGTPTFCVDSVGNVQGSPSGTAEKSSDFYRYTLIFRNVLYVGGGTSFSFDVSYPTSTQAHEELSFTIGQCIDTTSEESPGSTQRTPHLMVRSSSYGNTAINAGQAFTLAVTVYATKGNESLDDVTVTLDLRSEGISLQSGLLSQYLGSMDANSTREVYFTILPSIGFTGGVADIGVTLQGYGADTGTEAGGSVAISVPIEQPDRFEITGSEISDTIYVGEGGNVSLTFVNKGRNPVSNLEASISGTNLGADMPQQYLGSLAAETEGSVDFDLYPEEEGPITGVITLTYEAADGSIKTLTQDFTSSAMMMVYEDPGFYEDPGMMEEPKPGMPLWGWALIGAAAVGGVTAAVVLVRKRRKKKALASLEAADEDF